MLAVTWDGAGNVMPQLAVYRALTERGHRVRVLGHRTLQARIEAAGCEFVAYQTATDVDPARPAVPMAEEQAYQFEHILYGRGFALDVLSELDREPADLVLCDGLLFMPLAAAEARGVPAVVLWHSMFSGMGDEPLALFLNRDLHKLNALRAELKVPPVLSIFDQCSRAALVLAMTLREFDTPGVTLPENVRYVGPIFERPAGQPPEPFRRWAPDDKRPLVVVSFCLGFQGQQAALQRTLDALAGRNVRVLVTLGPAVRPDEVRAPRNVVVERYVPHDRVFPDAALIINHAGHGTVMRALAHGVPSLCLPMGRDQFLIAHRVSALGAGRVIYAEAPSMTLWREVEAILDDVHYKASAVALSLSIDDGGARRAVESIEALLPP